MVAAAGATALALAPGAGAVADPGVPIRGVDTSHYQHGNNAAIDWRTVAAGGSRFAFIKASEGTGVTDAWLARDLQGAGQAGLARAPYHFLSPGDGAAQAQHFLQVVNAAGYTGGNAGELPPVLDVEWAAGGGCPAFSVNTAIAFLETVRQATHRTPIVYTQQSFVSGCFGNTTALSPYLLWVVDTGRNPPRLPAGWSTWTFWQYNQAPVAGIPASAVDLDAFNGSANQLAALANGSGPMYHEIRNADGNWSGFRPVAGYGTTQPGDARDVAIAGMPDASGDAQLLLVGADGIVYHEIRHGNGDWSGLQPLAGAGTSTPAGASRVSIAGFADGSAQVLIVGADGHVYHEVRYADGSGWSGFQPLPGAGTSLPAAASRVSIAGLPDGSAQVLIVGADGHVYHEVRYPDGNWSGFQPLPGAGTSAPAAASDVAIAGLPDGSAQVLIIGADQHVYHEVRYADGSGWSGFRSLPGDGTTDPADGSAVSIGGLADGSAQIFIIGQRR